jgi:antitoxin (DNA-binding transcriptional repressor) of toxin-antitoxin stability system
VSLPLARAPAVSRPASTTLTRRRRRCQDDEIMAVNYSVQDAETRFAEVLQTVRAFNRVFIMDGDTVVAEIIPGPRVEGESPEDRRKRLIARGQIIPAEKSPKDILELVAKWKASGTWNPRPGAYKRYLAERRRERF